MKKFMFYVMITFVLLAILSGTSSFAQDLQSAIKLTRSEQFRKADLIFKSILQSNPGDGNACFYYGENFLQKYFSDTLTYSYKEMADSATSLFHSGIKSAPDNPLNYVGLGEVVLIKKNTIEAQSYFDKAIALLPSKSNKASTLSKKEQAVVMIKMANAYLKANINDSAKVLSLLRQAELLDNKNFDLYIVKGGAYMQILNLPTFQIFNFS